MAAGRRAWKGPQRANQDAGVGAEEARRRGEPIPCGGGSWEPSRSGRRWYLRGGGLGPSEGRAHAREKVDHVGKRETRLLADERREEADGELGWHRCPAVTHGRRRTRPRGRAGGEQEKPEVVDGGAWRRLAGVG
jgi:hypothetical protein